jgi:4-amino-4-deoxy-L-arabinose transferase-like glycosyltransferase
LALVQAAGSAVRPVAPVWVASNAAIALTLVVGASASDESVMHAWTSWDAGWYERIATDGYRGDGSGGSPAFYPLYPAAMRALSVLPWVGLGGAGVIVSVLSILVAYALLYRLAASLFDDRVARRSVLYLAVFPTVVFTQLVYSESLFLMLAVGTFVAAERRRLVLAGVIAGLAILTRPTGLALLPALVLFASRERRLCDGVASVALATGIFLLYPAFLTEQGRSPLAFADAEQQWERHWSSLGPLGGLVDGAHAAWGGWLQLTWGSQKPYWNTFHPNHEALVNITSLAALGITLALLVVVAMRLALPYAAYMVAALAMPLTFPADSRPLQSMPRFALALFPGFVALASLQLRAWKHAALMTTSAALALGVIGWWTSGWFVA